LSDQWNLNGVVGFESKNETSSFIGVTSEDQVVFDFLNHNNFRETSPIDSFSSLNTIGVYSQMELDYNDFIFLTLTARND
jgi:hypothetical protein